MVDWELGKRQQVRHGYEKAVAWTEKNQPEG